MEFTTKPVSNLDQDQFLSLVDEGYSWVSTRFFEEVASVTGFDQHGNLWVMWQSMPVSTPLRLSAISAVHKLDEEVSV